MSHEHTETNYSEEDAGGGGNPPGVISTSNAGEEAKSNAVGGPKQGFQLPGDSGQNTGGDGQAFQLPGDSNNVTH